MDSNGIQALRIKHKKLVSSSVIGRCMSQRQLNVTLGLKGAWKNMNYCLFSHALHLSPEMTTTSPIKSSIISSLFKICELNSLML